jgi:glycosyltransferase involved in cell wall biosynthesis
MNESPPLFVVLSPVWNAAPWVEKCLESVRRQTYPHLRHIWVDDASTDGTTAILKREVPAADLIINTERRFPSYNVWYALTRFIREDCIVGLLDGDDWLLDDTAVAQFVELHGRYDVVWSTHKVFEYDPAGEVRIYEEGPNPLHRLSGDPRRAGWQPTHFFSFKRHNFLMIDPKDFFTDDGAWFGAMYDMALSVPLLEMAGWERCSYFPHFLYAYNRLRPENDDKVRRELQKQLEGVISQKPPYSKR